MSTTREVREDLLPDVPEMIEKETQDQETTDTETTITRMIMTTTMTDLQEDQAVHQDHLLPEVVLQEAHLHQEALHLQEMDQEALQAAAALQAVLQEVPGAAQGEDLVAAQGAARRTTLRQ